MRMYSKGLQTASSTMLPKPLNHSFNFLRRVQMKHPIHHTFFEIQVDYTPNLSSEKTDAVVSLVDKEMVPVDHIGSYLQTGGYSNSQYFNYRKQVWEMARQLENSNTQLFENQWTRELQCQCKHFMESLGYWGSTVDECEQCLQENLLQCLSQLDMAEIKTATIPLWYPTNHVTKAQGEAILLPQERVVELMLDALVEQFFLRDFAFEHTAPLQKNLQLVRLVQMNEEDSEVVCKAFDKRQFAKEWYVFAIAQNHKTILPGNSSKYNQCYGGHCYGISRSESVFIPEFKDL